MELNLKLPLLSSPLYCLVSPYLLFSACSFRTSRWTINYTHPSSSASVQSFDKAVDVVRPCGTH